MKSILIALFYQPFLNALVFIYDTIGFQDLGISIILLTLAVRFALYPLFQKILRQQKVMQAMQPEIKKIQKDYAQDRVKQAEQLMALYAKYEISPAGPFILLLVQIPILIGLYQVFINVFTPGEDSYLYSFINNPGPLNNIAFGLMDLQNTYMMLVLLAVFAQYWQGRQTANTASGQPAFLVWIGPIITLVILFQMPSAIALYWLTTTVFSIVQQHFITSKEKNNGKVG